MEVITLRCDVRERDVIAALSAASIPHTVESLPLGDFWICIDDAPRICYERKTASDAEASINDGRYHEQSARMRAWTGVTCCYIYEALTCRTSKSVATVLRRNTLFRGIACIYTTSPDTTATLLSETMRDLDENQANTGRLVGASLCTKSPLIKNSAVPPEKAFEVMLSVLPKIGRKTAAAIAAVHKSPKQLCIALAQAEPHRRNEFVALTVPKVSRTISSYLAIVFGELAVS